MSEQNSMQESIPQDSPQQPVTTAESIPKEGLNPIFKEAGMPEYHGDAEIRTDDEKFVDVKRVANDSEMLTESFKRNDQRSRIQKLFGLGKVTKEDVIHEEAQKMNEKFDQRKKLDDQAREMRISDGDRASKATASQDYEDRHPL